MTSIVRNKIVKLWKYQHPPPAAAETKAAWRIEQERPVAGLPERLEGLRREMVGKPIAMGTKTEDGQPLDFQFVGHILPQDESDRWHVILLDNGMAAAVGQQASGAEKYSPIYGGTETLFFPAGTSKTEIFEQLSGKPHDHPWKNGAATYASSEYTAKPSERNELRSHIQKAITYAGETIRNRSGQRQEIGKFAADLIDQALNNAQPEEPKPKPPEPPYYPSI